MQIRYISAKGDNSDESLFFFTLEALNALNFQKFPSSNYSVERNPR